ncbi:MAG: FAD-binding oxidoreductase [Vicinamibacterales bacterium]|jgi:glycine/D-amino acid oxidase-like deaminating enzyme|nr:FAD-binding oxidoreductase [Vicinamibacterales bacterium]
MGTPGTVVIVGGGVIGSSIAYHLRRDGHAGRVVVVERDSTYTRASSFLAMGGIRQQFSSAVNVQLAQYSTRFYAEFDRTLKVPGHEPHVNFRQRGYLFLADDASSDRLEARIERQRRLGARVERLSLDQLSTLVPGVRLDDIRFGVFGPDDGYGEPRGVLAGFRAAAAAAGAEYVPAEVVGLICRSGRVAGVELDSGEPVGADAVVNAAGPFAARLGTMAGIDLPIQPVRQQLFRCALPARWPYRFPVVIDPTGVHWRHDDPVTESDPDRLVVARTRLSEPPGENFDCDLSRWESDFRPPLVRRVPGLDPLELVEGWAGLYAMTPDHNPLLGEHSAVAGFFLANGFSGHGLMIAPAVGKVLSELIRTGRADTVDVSCLDPGRFDRGELVHDEALI